VGSRMKGLAAAAGIAACGFAAGFVAGHRTTFAGGMRLLAAETQGNLGLRVETLAKLRTGDAAGAIAGLEQAVDTATMSLPQRRPWSDLDPDTRSTLQLVKAYRHVHPPAAPDPELTALLDSIPMPHVNYCSPALRQLLEASRRDER
jgi:hypothetical protein